MPAQEVAFKLEDLPVELSVEEREAIQSRLKLMEELLGDKTKAKYKIELAFASDRSQGKPTAGVVSFWENGSRLHGGGDAKLYMCPGKYLNRNDCQAFIPESANASTFQWCPKCGLRWKGEEVIGEHLARLTMQNWAQVIFNYFMLMESNADIYLKFTPTDIRSIAAKEQQAGKGGELLLKARNVRGKAIYPLRNIIRDTTAGADLLKRFYAFLSA